MSDIAHLEKDIMSKCFSLDTVVVIIAFLLSPVAFAGDAQAAGDTSYVFDHVTRNGDGSISIFNPQMRVGSHKFPIDGYTLIFPENGYSMPAWEYLESARTGGSVLCALAGRSYIERKLKNGPEVKSVAHLKMDGSLDSVGFGSPIETLTCGPKFDGSAAVSATAVSEKYSKVGATAGNFTSGATDEMDSSSASAAR